MICSFLTKYDKKIDQVMTDLKQVFDLDDTGTVIDFLGVNVEQEQNKIKLTQPHLIEAVINNLTLQ